MSAEIAAKVYQLVKRPISCHCWSKDGNALAVCPNDETILIFERDRGDDEWRQTSKLIGHDQAVAAMDWYSNGSFERLISVSMDRNGYVWSRTKSGKPSGQWEMALVLLRLRRSATSVKWSSDGNKFAVGSSEGVVSVCSYDQQDNWWSSKHLKNLDGSAILSLDWHPSGKFLAISTISGKVFLLSAHLKGVDAEGGFPDWLDANIAKSFDQEIQVFEMSSWVHEVAFSSNGGNLAMAAHDGKVHLVDLVQNVEHLIPADSELPIRKCRFLNDTILVFSSFRSTIPSIAFCDSNGVWRREATPKASESPSGTTVRKEPSNTTSNEETRGAFGGAFAKFRAMDSQGIEIKGNANGAPLELIAKKKTEMHKSSISEIQLMPDGEKISTSGHDGRLVIWNFHSLRSRLGFSDLSIAN